MASVSEDLLEEARQLLLVNLPAKLTAAGVTDQPTNDANGYRLGDPELKPTSSTPYVSVDRAAWTQRSAVLGHQGPRNQEKRFEILIHCVVSGSSVADTAQRLWRFSDAVAAVFEDAYDLSDKVLLAQVIGGDDSPTFRLPGGSRLFRANVIRVRIWKRKTRGAVT